MGVGPEMRTLHFLRSPDELPRTGTKWREYTWQPRGSHVTQKKFTLLNSADALAVPSPPTYSSPTTLARTAHCFFPGGKGEVGKGVGWWGGVIAIGWRCQARDAHATSAGGPKLSFAYWGRAYLFEKMPLRPVGPWGPRQVGSRPVRFSASAPFLKLIRLDELALILRVVVVLRWAEHWVARTL